jgi:hypothetical protein
MPTGTGISAQQPMTAQQRQQQLEAAHVARAEDQASAIFAQLGLGPRGELVLPGGAANAMRSVGLHGRHRNVPGGVPAAVEYSSSLTTTAPTTARFYYKAVAVAEAEDCGARFLSIYDGTTQYRIGVDLHQPMNDDDLGETCGGFFCFNTAEEVFSAIVPQNSVLKNAERAIIKCAGWGRRRRFPNGKLCIEHLRPLSIHAFPQDFIPGAPVSQRGAVIPAARDTSTAAAYRDTSIGSRGVGRRAPGGGPATRQLAIENFALEEEVRQMEARLAAARTMRGWSAEDGPA